MEQAEKKKTRWEQRKELIKAFDEETRKLDLEHARKHRERKRQRIQERKERENTHHSLDPTGPGTVEEKRIPVGPGEIDENLLNEEIDLREYIGFVDKDNITEWNDTRLSTADIDDDLIYDDNGIPQATKEDAEKYAASETHELDSKIDSLEELKESISEADIDAQIAKLKALKEARKKEEES